VGVGELLNLLMPMKLLAPIVKPLVRLLLGFIAIPLFRLFLRRVVRISTLDAELEKDVAQWLRGSLMLLVATANMENLFFKWVPLDWREDNVWLIGLRLLLAIGVIEGMPDQALFSIIHPGPPPFRPEPGRFWPSVKAFIPKFLKGLVCQHLNRSSPVLAILTVFFTGTVGWVCYALAITNYLIMGLVSSRDKAIDVLKQFDEAVLQQRRELEQEVYGPLPIDGITAEQRVQAAEHGGAFVPEEAITHWNHDSAVTTQPSEDIAAHSPQPSHPVEASVVSSPASPRPQNSERPETTVPQSPTP
jgi:hypothetical protein